MTIDPTTITVAQFKAAFPRGFPYLPVYDPTATYNTGDEVYFGGLFYTSTIDANVGTPPGPGVAAWSKAVDSLDNWVQDTDIAAAQAEAIGLFNPGLIGVDATSTLAFNLLTAHQLALALRGALAGPFAAAAFPVSSRSAGPTSESYAIPEGYLADPVFAQYAGTAYGLRYLAMVLPLLRGNVTAVFGSASP